MSDAAIRVHLERLVAMEYVRLVAGKNGQRFEYELLVRWRSEDARHRK